MLFTETVGRPVVSAADAITVGVVDGFIMDATAARVVALRLKKGVGRGDLLPWSQVHTVGPDAVIVRSGETAQPAEGEFAALADKHRDLLGKRILTDAGNEAGTVTDADFDPDTGDLLTLLTSTAEIAGHRTIGLGSYALVIAGRAAA